LLCVPSAALLTRVPRIAPRRALLALAGVLGLMLTANAQLPPDISVPFAHANAATVFAAAGDASRSQAEQEQAHAARRAVEARDPHACAQLPPF
jgi:hypothetical protein